VSAIEHAGGVSGVLLAAGAGRRLGTPKAQVVLDGTRLLDRGIAVLLAAGCTEVVVVLRAPEQLSGVISVVNPDPDRGMGSSLRLGLAACTQPIAVVNLVDTPGIGAADVRRVVDEVRSGAAAAIVSHDGHQLPPVAFARAVWPEVARLAEGDQGARAFLRAHPDLVVTVACAGDPSDIDTPADLASWRERAPARSEQPPNSLRGAR
jgi:CTP:molybdopterin cytidylyltransferase MocA